jgi:hypothetical protein
VKKSFLMALIPFALLVFLTSCTLLEPAGSSSGDSSSESSSSKLRITPAEVFAKLANKNVTNTVNFRSLSGSEDTSNVTAANPILKASYISDGFQFDFSGTWGTSAPSSFGIVAIPSSLANPGVYRYTLDNKKALVLGEKVDAASSDAYLSLGDFTPYFLFENAGDIGSKFAPTSRSEYNTMKPGTANATQADLVAVAKSLNVYSILTEAVPEISFAYIDLNYSASSTSYTFTFYVDYNGAVTDYNSASGSASSTYYVGARAVLSAVGSTSVAPLTAYLNGLKG